MMTMNDPYKILGVKETDSDEEIKRAYRELVKSIILTSMPTIPCPNLPTENQEINAVRSNNARETK